MESRCQNSWAILNKFITSRHCSKKSDSEGILACPASVDTVRYKKTHTFFIVAYKLYTQNHVFVIISACTLGTKNKIESVSLT